MTSYLRSRGNEWNSTIYKQQRARPPAGHRRHVTNSLIIRINYAAYMYSTEEFSSKYCPRNATFNAFTPTVVDSVICDGASLGVPLQESRQIQPVWWCILADALMLHTLLTYLLIYLLTN